MRVLAFLKVIDNSLNFCLDSFGFSYVLTSSNPLGVSQLPLVLSSGTLVLQVLYVLNPLEKLTEYIGQLHNSADVSLYYGLHFW